MFKTKTNRRLLVWDVLTIIFFGVGVYFITQECWWMPLLGCIFVIVAISMATGVNEDDGGIYR